MKRDYVFDFKSSQLKRTNNNNYYYYFDNV